MPATLLLTTPLRAGHKSQTLPYVVMPPTRDLCMLDPHVSPRNPMSTSIALARRRRWGSMLDFAKGLPQMRKSGTRSHAHSHRFLRKHGFPCPSLGWPIRAQRPHRMSRHDKQSLATQMSYLPRHGAGRNKRNSRQRATLQKNTLLMMPPAKYQPDGWGHFQGVLALSAICDQVSKEPSCMEQ